MCIRDSPQSVIFTPNLASKWQLERVTPVSYTHLDVYKRQVPEGKARIRTIMTATHTKKELQQALEVLGRVGKRMGIVA